MRVRVTQVEGWVNSLVVAGANPASDTIKRKNNESRTTNIPRF